MEWEGCSSQNDLLIDIPQHPQGMSTKEVVVAYVFISTKVKNLHSKLEQTFQLTK